MQCNHFGHSQADGIGVAPITPVKGPLFSRQFSSLLPDHPYIRTLFESAVKESNLVCTVLQTATNINWLTAHATFASPHRLFYYTRSRTVCQVIFVKVFPNLLLDRRLYRQRVEYHIYTSRSLRKPHCY